MNRQAFHILLTASLICGLFLPSALGQQTVLDKRISLEVKERSIPEVIKLIRRQTGYFISYANHELDANKKVTQTYKETRVEDLLRSLWKPQAIDLQVVGNTIEVRTLETKGSGSQLRPRGNIEGRVRTNDFRAISYARVSFKESNRGILTDSLGRFGFKGIEAGEYTLQISAVGYEEHELDVEVKASRTSPVEILLEAGGYSLDDVLIEGKSLTKEMAEQAIVVNTINASNIQAQTLDVAKVLDKVEGVRIRQSGGLGSTTSISINGLTGNAIRFYYNGIPSDFLGGGFQLNTLPISNVDRIEVYKGVMPANIGTDALGGGINVATNDDGIKKVDLSYQFGSFNTHRAAASITRPLGERWFINLNTNYNYSDNNFEMEVGNNTYDPTLPFPTGTETIRVRRFHDAFSAFLGNVLVGYSNVEEGLSIKMGVYVTAVYKELQHGIRVGFVPIGEALFRNQDSYFKLDVEKTFSDKLSFFYAGVGGYSRLQTRDSTLNIYDWYGRIASQINPAISRGNGAEFLVRPSISDIFNYNTVQRFGSTLKLPYNFSVSLNHFFAYQKRQGSEELKINYIGGEDPNEKGFRITRNITALEVKKTLFSEKLEILSTLKAYQYSTEGVNTLVRNRDSQTELPIITNREAYWGFNSAAKWEVNDRFFLRASFEDALRVPTQNEIFGDLRTIIPNFSLRPERSRNFNAGFNAVIHDALKVNVNYFLRSQRDLILLQFIDTETARFINRTKVFSSGAEIALSGTIIPNLTYTWNTTYFNIEIREVAQPQDEFLIGSPVPNIPTFFSNVGLSYELKDVFKDENDLQFNLDAQFVDEFSFIQEGNIRNDENWIPMQFSVDAGFTYKIKDHLSFNFQANNLFDAALFDFISVPRPGTNFAVKVRWNY